MVRPLTTSFETAASSDPLSLLGAKNAESRRIRTEIRKTPFAFTVAYNDRESSFSKAALTWAKESAGGLQCFHASFGTLEEFIRVFKGLLEHAKRNAIEYQRGALFVHSSAPHLDQKVGPHASFGLETRPPRVTTMAEQRRLEDLGLNPTAGIAQIKMLPRLPWASGALLNVYGCHSGGTTEVPGGIAEILAITQKVQTTGESGKAYFSQKPAEYVEIGPESKSIYLRAFYRLKNIGYDLLEGEGNQYESIANFNEAMPQRRFWPSN